MKKIFNKIIQSISITIILLVVNIISSPLPALATTYTDTYSGTTNINTSSSYKYAVSGGQLKMETNTYANWKMDEAISNNSTNDSGGFGFSSAPANLVGWWKMDEAANDTCNKATYNDVCDSSGNQNHGAQAGTTIIAGKYGNGRSYTGGGSDVVVADSTSLKPSTITIEAWIKTTTSADQLHLYKYNPSSPYQGYALATFGSTQSGKLGCWVGGGSWVLSSSAINDNTWHHVACTTNGSTTTVYVDGVAGTPVSQTASLSYAIDLEIGANSNVSFDDVRIYNTVLTSTQINADMNYLGPRNGVNENGLVGYWSLNETSGTSVIDSSGNGNTGTTAITSSTGGTITTSGSYIVHTFTSSGTFTPGYTGNVSVVVVGGGGGGAGGNGGGGGGAGGVQTNASYAVTAGSAITVTVGPGGNGGASATAGNAGTASVFGTITANGGGAGGKGNGGTNPGGTGGNGGGAGAWTSGAQPAGGTGNQGYNGGSTTNMSSPYPSGGGGGAGETGVNGSSSASGRGGAGVSVTVGAGTVSLAGGGGGGGTTQGATVGSATYGGGAGGAPGNPGTANTGGGGGGATGTVSGGTGGSGVVYVYYPLPSAPTIIDGQYGKAKTFNGTSDAAVISDNSTLDLTGAISIEAWVKFDSALQDYETIIGKRDVSASEVNYTLRTGNGAANDEIEFVYYANGSFQQWRSSDANLTTGVWYHLAATFDGTSTFALYKDGVPLTGSCSTGTCNVAMVADDNSLGIGRPGDKTNHLFKGTIDEVRLYNVALSQATIAEHINKSILGPQIVAGNSGSARSFDGATDYIDIPSNANLRPAKNFTVEAWVNIDDCNDNRQIIKTSDDGGGNDSWGLRITNGCKLLFNASNLNGWAAQALESTETLTPGVWYHVAGTYTSDNVLKTYVNGAAPTTKQAAGDVAYTETTNGLVIGRRGGTFSPNTLYYKGLIDDIRFYNYARTDAQIAAEAAGGAFSTNSYPNSATIISTNLLTGLTSIDGIDEFVYNLSALPANTSATVTFSQDGTNWYNSSGVLNGTNTLSLGTNNTIDIHNLTWSGSNFYYKAVLSSDSVSTPTLNDVAVNYTTGSGYTASSGTGTETFSPVTSSSGLSYGPSKVQLIYSGEEGSGIDGAITVGANTSINSTNIISGRTCTDGGDAPNYSVSALTSTTATLTTSPAASCLKPGDEVLLINLQGGSSSTITNVGNYETLRIASISGSTITFATAKSKYYGDGASDDTNLGVGVTNQKVMLQRVPNYSNVTVSAGYNLYPNTYNYSTGKGGVIFFRANGTVTVASTASINANSSGYAGGIGGSANNVPGYPGHGLFYTSATDGRGGISGTGVAGTYSGGGGNSGTSTATAGAGTSNVGSGGGGGSGSSPLSSACGGRSGGGGGGGYAAGGGGGIGIATNGNGTAGNTSNSGAGGKGGGGCSGQSQSGGGGGGAGNYGIANLSKLYFGGGGGGVGIGGTSDSGLVAGPNGGAGGGIVQIYANTLSVSGTVSSYGASSAASPNAYWAGCGGGGAGGSIKLVGGSLTLGSSLVVASGGVGTTGDCASYMYGGAGSVGRIAVGGSNVTGTTSPTKTDISALSTGTYATTGTYTSTNLLSSISNLTSIDSFTYNASSIPANTGITVTFSQDGTNWYNSSAVSEGTDTLSSGTNTISLSTLGWKTPYFYYKMTFTGNGSVTPTLASVVVNYSTSTKTAASSSWGSCTPLQSGNFTVSSNCYLPKTGHSNGHTDVDGADNGNIVVNTYKTLTIKGDQQIVRNNGKSITLQGSGSMAINDIPIGGVGGNVRDYSGNNYEGRAIGTTVVAGKYNKARYFNGTSDYVEITNDALGNFGSGDFTLETWLKLGSLTQNRALLIGKDNAAVTGQRQIVFNWDPNNTNANKLRIAYFDTSNNQITGDTADNIIADLNWHHIAAGRSGNSFFMYIDGSPVTLTTTGTHATMQTTQANINIGRRGETTPDYLLGIMDDVRIYDYARSQEQVGFDMNNREVSGSNPPIAWYKFEDGGQIKETNIWAWDTDDDGWSMNLETQDRAQTASPSSEWKRRNTIIGSVFGTGRDGSITFTTNTNLSTYNSGTRSCSDGGDAVSYNLTGLGTLANLPNNLQGTIATASATIATGCLNAEDNVLLMNVQGSNSAYGNTGNYEMLKVYSVSGSTITFTTTKRKYYGDGASDDTNIGTATTNQRVIVQRVPQYENVTINNGVTLSSSTWNGSKGGILAFSSSGTFTNNGTIDQTSLGFRAGAGGTPVWPGYGGETYNGYAAYGDGGSGSGGVGGGGGGTRSSGSVKSQTGSIGGAGGGGGARWGGSGGAGYGTVGSGGTGAGGGAANGQNGSGTTGGNGGSSISNGGGGGGGGGTYGDANLTKLMLGSGGGGSGAPADGGGGTTGGNGGGIVFIAARTFTNNGSILSSGQAQGSGGSGGSIKIYSLTATLGTVTASGVNLSGNGRIAVGANSISGSTTPTYTAITKP